MPGEFLSAFFLKFLEKSKIEYLKPSLLEFRKKKSLKKICVGIPKGIFVWIVEEIPEDIPEESLMEMVNEFSEKKTTTEFLSNFLKESLEKYPKNLKAIFKRISEWIPGGITEEYYRGISETFHESFP